MNKDELKALVAQLLGELHQEPTVKAGDYKPTCHIEDATLPDITKINLRQQYLVEQPKNPKAFLDLKAKTPARLGVGKAGPRYRTSTLLRFRADHAAAQDSVFKVIGEDFAKEHGLIPLKTRCKDKDEYLTRPDLGRVFDEVNQKVIAGTWKGARVMIVIGDGLSSAAIEANAIDCAAAIRQGLQAAGITIDKIPFIQFCRVGAGDHIGDLTGCELLCLLVGERPGLVTSESMSAYITYRPHKGIPEAKRTVVSNIHSQGIPAVEAGAHIAALMETMLKQKASGLDLKQELSHEG
ncbi:MAG: ethanolamine ammonia-lyase subunit EutC [Oscillospiraceae bacterium]|nr:ethanolamine ammonia-lyase subunit EutC [Oscillospiraceae bacterium]